MKPALTPVPRLQHAGAVAGLVAGQRTVPEEAAVAFHYNGRSHAVMMATPADLEDFAVGFSLAESLVASAQDITDIQVRPAAGDGIDVHITTRGGAADTDPGKPHHRLTGPSGCGLCGVQCTQNALRPVQWVRRPVARWTAETVAMAMRGLQGAQQLNRQARALHAAGFWAPGPQGSLVAVREDIGRHCALDKLAGALARQGVHCGGGAVLLTSRVSLELVQKTARLGACLLIAVSAPTALAVRTAQAAGITLIAVARGAEFEVFTHPERVAGAEAPRQALAAA